MMEFEELFESTSWKPNDPEIEWIFRETCAWYESQCSTSGQLPSQDYQEYVNLYHKSTSLYQIKDKEKDLQNRTKLIIYDTESEREEVKILDTPEQLDKFTCITQLPNGELFCYGKNYPISGIALIIDKNYNVKTLPSGTPIYYSSCIYFNNNVYCFGGHKYEQYPKALSRKFDLTKNRWNKLTPMPKADSFCSNVIFNENILICGFDKNLLLYSIDIDSFSTIYEFKHMCGKIMINVNKLYVIEICYNGVIYESEDGYHWNGILEAKIDYSYNQAYCIYNKGVIYISKRGYFKFDLTRKIVTEFK